VQTCCAYGCWKRITHKTGWQFGWLQAACVYKQTQANISEIVIESFIQISVNCDAYIESNLYASRFHCSFHSTAAKLDVFEYWPKWIKNACCVCSICCGFNVWNLEVRGAFEWRQKSPFRLSCTYASAHPIQRETRHRQQEKTREFLAQLLQTREFQTQLLFLQELS